MNPRKKKRILYVHSTLHIGGAEEVTANLCNRIDKSRYEITVCCLKENGVIGDKITLRGVPTIGLPGNIQGRVNYFTFFKLRSLITRLKIDLIHSHDVHALADCSLCKITLPRLKFVHTFHFGNYPQRDRSSGRIEKLFWRVPDQLVSVSEQQRENICRYFGFNQTKITTIWNGVDVEAGADCNFPIDIYRKNGRIIIGSVSTLIEQKGISDLLKVAALLKQRLSGKFVFLVAGDGYLRKELETQCSEMGLKEEVCFLGWVESASQSFLPHLDIFFQPSLWEAMSMVLLEAMANGKAIVASGVGETPLIMQNGVHGILTEPKNIDSMADALESLIIDGKKRAFLGNMAKKRYHEAFTAQKMAARYEFLYDSLLHG